MSKLKSDKGAAQAVASSISSSVSSLSSAAAITKDEQTTVAGNASSHTAIDNLSTFNSQLISSVNQATTNIQSVAAEFEATDQDLKKKIENY